MYREVLNNNIKVLNLESNILDKLKDNSISTIDQLYKFNRKELKKINLKDSEINQIIIKLQLMGLDLNKKKY